ncbi:hypothetical protein FRC17_010689 [Serendipita sp. 399]|nr:hypothetical protein FRC17_010689 [Serendipita sp. 399]
MSTTSRFDLNRVPSREEMMMMQKLIDEGNEELASLAFRMQKRQAASERSQKAVNEIEATVKTLERIQVSWKKRLDFDSTVEAVLGSKYILPAASAGPTAVGSEVPRLAEVALALETEIDRSRRGVQGRIGWRRRKEASALSNHAI